MKTAIEHYEAALKEAFPSGATGDVFHHWNEARKALEQPALHGRGHVTDGSPCWCNPDVIEEDGGDVIVHNYGDNWQQYAKQGETAQQCIERHRSEQDALLELLKQAREPAQQEPVAKVYRHGRASNGTPWHGVHWFDEGINMPDGTLLYTRPQAREPLTDEQRADAARYRFLAEKCRSTSEHWGGRWSIVIEGPAPKTHDSEDDFDEAIDRAIEAKLREKNT